jgi:hypothetical protein
VVLPWRGRGWRRGWRRRTQSPWLPLETAWWWPGYREERERKEQALSHFDSSTIPHILSVCFLLKTHWSRRFEGRVLGPPPPIQLRVTPRRGDRMQGCKESSRDGNQQDILCDSSRK